MRDRDIVLRIRKDVETDLMHSTEQTLERWRKRPLWEKLIGTIAWILERQQ